MAEDKKRAVNITITALTLIATVIAIITFSIGLPIYFRPFYYMQIGPLGIEESTGYDKETVMDGYDEVLDYLTRPGGSFSAGVFKFSDEGAGHFEDCKVLFTLNAWCYVISLALIAVVLILVKRSRVKLCRPFGFSVFGVAGASTLVLFATLAALAAIDFDRAFVIFHSVFFPGKDNWLFHPSRDEIILAMPEEFFMNCAILIASSVILISLVLVVFALIRRKKEKSV